MNETYNTHLIPFAKRLRKEMTKEEKRLWYDCLRDLPVPFYRQKVINHYIVDFYSAKAKIVIELDGSQHYEPEKIEQDAIRDDMLKKSGYKVLRYTNYEINMNFYGVCTDILENVKSALSELGRKPTKDSLIM